MQLVKSPLRYPGGKSKALLQIQKYIPPNFAEFREPFVGGGSLFIYIRQKFPTVQVWINDLNYELFSFWICTRDDLERLVDEVLRIKKNKSDGRKLFQELTTVDVGTLSQLERAIRFFVLNRISFSGTVDAGGFSEKAFHARFTYSAIERLTVLKKIMPGVKITNADYSAVIHQSGDKVFIFLDPPYHRATKSRLYGRNGILHTTFDHDVFANEMSKCRHEWLITYDNSEKIRRNFHFASQYEWKLQYGMNNYKKSSAEMGNELFIANYPIMEQDAMSQMTFAF